ncbi:MAG: hypothetical protein IPK77_11175 [Cellvibrio sp.]|nr:hypothetical protein [Cellvibrio sp.]
MGKLKRQDYNIKRKLTDDELIGFMVEFLNNNDQLPPHLNIANHFCVNVNAITERLARLERDGILERNAVNKYRFARLSNS